MRHLTKKKVISMIVSIIALLVLVLLVFVGRGAYMLKTQIPGFREFWIAKSQEPIPDNARIYVALGDSVAQGIGAANVQESYVWLFAEHLKETENRPVHIVNLSVSGAKIQDVIDSQLPQMKALGRTPDVVTIDIGANNMRRFDPVQFEKEYDSLLGQLPAGTLVADIPYFGPDYHNHGGRQAKEANLILAKILPKYPVVPVGIYAVTEGNDGLSYYGADVFHPSSKSYRLWTDAFIAASKNI